MKICALSSNDHGEKSSMYKPPGIVPPGGTHLFVDLFEANQLDDIRVVEEICTRAAQATGATVIRGNFHHFGDGCGISGVVLLAESHLAIHTWPEEHLATVDIYVCGTCQAANAIPILRDGFSAMRLKVSEHRRGLETEVHYRIRISPSRPQQDEHFVIQTSAYSMTLSPESATSFTTRMDAENALRAMPNLGAHGHAVVEEFPK
jgi:S-adenosylmethionine decarboxylase